MKTTILLLLIAVVGVYSQTWIDTIDAFGQTRSWTGNTSTSTTTFFGPNVAQGTTSCSARSHQTPYYYVTVSFATSGVRQVGAMAEFALKPHLQVWVYNGTFTPNTACLGLDRGLYNGNYLGDSGILTINDPYYFTAGVTYQLVVTSADDTVTGGEFALSIFGTTNAGTTVNGPSWIPTTTNTGPCTVNTPVGNQSLAVYTWTQDKSGPYDVQVFFENTNELPNSITANNVNFAIYKGSFSAASLQQTPCPASAIDITAGEADLMVSVLYHMLTEDQVYTIAVSNKVAGNFGIQILPTRVNLAAANGDTFTQPSTNPVSCTASTFTASGYVLVGPIQAAYDTHFFDTYQIPTYQYLTSFPEITFAYSGLPALSGSNIPACGTGFTVLAGVGTGANSTLTPTPSSSAGPLIAKTTVGSTYSVVIADLYGNSLATAPPKNTNPPAAWASQLYVLAGNNLVASTTTTGTATTSTTGATGTTATTTTGATTVTPTTTGTTTTGATTSTTVAPPTVSTITSGTTSGATTNHSTPSPTPNPTSSTTTGTTTAHATTSGAAALSFSAFFLLAAFLALF